MEWLEIGIKPSSYISSLCYSVFRLEPFTGCVFDCLYCYARWYRGLRAPGQEAPGAPQAGAPPLHPLRPPPAPGGAHPAVKEPLRAGPPPPGPSHS
ncbi:hypothetical protein CF15_05000 [Pyrodictium occultum]|uniref:Uncharacterized protein n=1 Tax=Pyrodictium occultum TaxID=2309 RepID=A0A0V8RVQ0_PYROC|nr:hypothetical protein [Pyrodictium occultum]KSW12127.1 hypothetical protein CF15_05000 [Pyrodictium occultum]